MSGLIMFIKFYGSQIQMKTRCKTAEVFHVFLAYFMKHFMFLMKKS